MLIFVPKYLTLITLSQIYKIKTKSKRNICESDSQPILGFSKIFLSLRILIQVKF